MFMQQECIKPKIQNDDQTPLVNLPEIDLYLNPEKNENYKKNN